MLAPARSHQKNVHDHAPRTNCRKVCIIWVP
jgi:hypothetical protein